VGAHDPARNEAVDRGGLELPSIGEDMLRPDDVDERLAQRRSGDGHRALTQSR
jgi:hypothetical protein